MSERTKELGNLADTMYAHSLSFKSMYSLVITVPDPFNDQSMSIG